MNRKNENQDNNIDLTDEMEKLNEEIERLSGENTELEDKYIRLAAEFDNYRKRQSRIFKEMVDSARDDLVLKFLEIIDNFERAIDSGDVPHDGDTVIEGVHLIYKQLLDMLETEDIEQICPKGEPFDPHLHEAISYLPGEAEDNTVMDVVQKGYRCGDRLIRPAKVVVAAPRDDEEHEES